MLHSDTLLEAKILVVDDDPVNVKLLERLLEWAGYQNVRSATSGEGALAEQQTFDPDLIFLDLHMPGMDGYDVLTELRASSEFPEYLPILVFTADATREAREKALSLGASDFLTKPGDATEIMLRTKNFLHMRRLDQSLRAKNKDLEALVRERTCEMENAQVDMVTRLAVAGEYRDNATGEHTQRVGDLSAAIAVVMDFDDQQVELIRLAARLHDVGKLGIPDSILSKSSPLTEAEFEEMRTHASIGAAILSGSRAPLLLMAQRIAHSHHEHFDGSGYPSGLLGEAIPIEARIVAVADAFDALMTEGPNKHAGSVDSLREIQALSGSQFDPRVVGAFMGAMKARLVKAA